MTIDTRTIRDEKGGNVTVSVSSKDESWRLVHDGSVIVSMFHASGYTETKHTLFLSATLQECFDEAERVGLSNVEDYAQQLMAEQLEESFRTMKEKGESPMAFAAALLSKTSDPVAVMADLKTAAVEIAASRPGTKLPPKLIK